MHKGLSMPISVKIDHEVRPWECAQTDKYTDTFMQTGFITSHAIWLYALAMEQTMCKMSLPGRSTGDPGCVIAGVTSDSWCARIVGRKCHTSAVSRCCGLSDVCRVSTPAQTADRTRGTREVECRRGASDAATAGCGNENCDRRHRTKTLRPDHQAYDAAGPVLHTIQQTWRLAH